MILDKSADAAGPGCRRLQRWHLDQVVPVIGVRDEEPWISHRHADPGQIQHAAARFPQRTAKHPDDVRVGLNHVDRARPMP